MRRGQAAIEFLMTYGWAILVVLVAIAALWFFVGNPQALVADNCRVAAPLNCEGQSALGSTITMRIRNGLTEIVTITDISLPDEGCNNVAPTSGGTINAGQISSVVFTCTGVAAGDKVRSAVTIEYSTPGLANRVATGNLVVTSGLSGSGQAQGGNGGGGGDQNICQNAQDAGLCEGLDILFGEGYQANCCSSFGLCCS